MWPISASVSIQFTGQLWQLRRTNSLASPAPRYVGCSTTRASIHNCAFKVWAATRERLPLSPKATCRQWRDNGGAVKTQMPMGSSPCHSKVTCRTSPMVCPR